MVSGMFIKTERLQRQTAKKKGSSFISEGPKGKIVIGFRGSDFLTREKKERNA